MSDEATFLASINSFLREHVPGTHFVATPANGTTPARYSIRGLDGLAVPLNAGQRDDIIAALGRRGIPPHTIIPTGTAGDARLSILQDGRMRVDGLDYYGARQNGQFPTVQNLPPENWRVHALSAERVDAIQRQTPAQVGRGQVQPTPAEPHGIHETPGHYERVIGRGQVQPTPAEPHARVQPSPTPRGRYAALATPFIAAASLLFGDNAQAATGQGQHEQRPTNTGDFFRIIGGQHPSHDTALGRTVNAGYERFNNFMNNDVREAINGAAERVVQAVTPQRPPPAPKP